MWVGGLRVVDIGDAVGDGHHFGAMSAHPEAGQRVGNRTGGHVDGPRHARRTERVEHPDRTRHGDGRGLRKHQLVGESVVHQRALPHTDFPERGRGEPETDPHRRRRGGQQPSRHRVLEPAHGHPPRQCPRLGPRVGVHRPVPVQMILGDVEHHAGVRAQRRRPVQLEAGQLDRQHVDRAVEHIEHRLADVAAQRGASATCLQHRVQHRRRRRLAVGAGHHQPLPRGPVTPRPVQPPRQLDVTPHRHARCPGGGQHRRRGREPGAGDHQREVGDRGGRLGGVDHRHALSCVFGQRRGPIVGQRGAYPERSQGGQDGAAGDAGPGDQDRTTGFGESGHLRHRRWSATRCRTEPHPDHRRWR